MQDAVKGASAFVRGFSMLGKPKIRRLVAAPVLISTLVFGGLVWFTAAQFVGVVDWMVGLVPEWLVWIEWILWALFAALAGGLVFFSFLLVVGLIAGPFNGPLAEATEIHLTGSGAASTPLHKVLLGLPATILDEVKKVVYALVLAVPFLLLFLIPAVNIAAPFLWFLCCAWVTAFSYTDYSMSNHGMKLAQIRAALARRRLLALGFGSAAFAAFMVPFLNILAVPAAVCGGAILWVEELRGGSEDG